MLTIRLLGQFVVDVDGHKVAHDLTTRALAKRVSDQKIAVSSHDVAGHLVRTQRCQRLEHGIKALVVFVVTNPDLEQVAENEQAICVDRVIVDEADEPID